MHDDIDQPCFIFQGDENDAGGGSRPLATDDNAGGADQGAKAGRRRAGGVDPEADGVAFPP